MIHFIQELTFGPSKDFIEFIIGAAFIGYGLTESFNFLMSDISNPKYDRGVSGLLFFILGIYFVVSVLGGVN